MSRKIPCPHCRALLKLTMEDDQLVAEVAEIPKSKKLVGPDDDLDRYIRGESARGTDGGEDGD